MVAPSLYPKFCIKSNRAVVSCNKCDICKNFFITDSNFRYTITGKTYFIKGNLSFDSPNNKHAYFKVQIIEHIFNNNQFSIENLLWEQEKY